MNLYEINEAVETAFNLAVDPNTGEIDDDQLYLLEMLEMDRSKKIENIACLIKNYRADAAALKAEKDAFQKRQQQAERKAESLSRYLETALNGEKFSSDRCAINFRKTSKVVLDDNVTVFDIDTHFLKMAEPTLDKVAIKKALDEGVVIEGVHIEPGLSINIK